MPIGGSDFDLAPWAYNELPINDTDLSNFTKLDDRDLTRVKDGKNYKSSYSHISLYCFIVNSTERFKKCHR